MCSVWCKSFIVDPGRPGQYPGICVVSTGRSPFQPANFGESSDGALCGKEVVGERLAKVPAHKAATLSLTNVFDAKTKKYLRCKRCLLLLIFDRGDRHMVLRDNDLVAAAALLLSCLLFGFDHSRVSKVMLQPLCN
eukprot:SAG25_NODE_164_length_13142_cov_11.645787_12_plen_136_part_00